MEHLQHLCNDHQAFVYVLMILLLLAGVGIAMFFKIILPALIRAFGKEKSVSVNVGGVEYPNSHNDHIQAHGPYCPFPCPDHQAMAAFMADMKIQQKKNVEVINAMQTQQSANMEIISELRRQQAKMWLVLDQIPNEFGDLKGELGEIKGMISILHDRPRR